MTKFNTIPGFTGSEIERATMAGSILPTETAVERIIKQQLARGLTRLANYIDPSIVSGFNTPKVSERYC
ncbi:MAG: hypothetical protein ACR2QW_19430 [bacterium]